MDHRTSSPEVIRSAYEAGFIDGKKRGRLTGTLISAAVMVGSLLLSYYL